MLVSERARWSIYFPILDPHTALVSGWAGSMALCELAVFYPSDPIKFSIRLCFCLVQELQSLALGLDHVVVLGRAPVPLFTKIVNNSRC
jgi:hypothetical protein